jgi:hypothetical protein
MVYRFDRIEAGYRHRVAARELFVEPGVVYITE